MHSSRRRHARSIRVERSLGLWQPPIGPLVRVNRFPLRDFQQFGRFHGKPDIGAKERVLRSKVDPAAGPLESCRDPFKACCREDKKPRRVLVLGKTDGNELPAKPRLHSALYMGHLAPIMLFVPILVDGMLHYILFETKRTHP